MARLMGLLGKDGSGEDEDIEGEAEETEEGEEERKDKKEEKSGDETQEDLKTSCDERQQIEEDSSCIETVDAKVVAENDILKELWR